jgi:hypothetical protein
MEDRVVSDRLGFSLEERALGLHVGALRILKRTLSIHQHVLGIHHYCREVETFNGASGTEVQAAFQGGIDCDNRRERKFPSIWGRPTIPLAENLSE